MNEIENIKKQHRIYIGDYWGRKYDYFRYYIPFALKYDVRFVNWYQCMEAIKDPNMYDVFLPVKDDLILDIGTQFGDYAILWEKSSGAVVYAYELDYGNYSMAKRNIELNHSGVKLFNIPIGDGSAITYNYLGAMAVKSDNGASVKTTTIDSLNLKPSLLKIDVEGFELAVLHGAEQTLKNNNIRLIIETHSKELRKQCTEFLHSLGYSLYKEGRKTKGKEWMDEVVNLFFTQQPQEMCDRVQWPRSF